MDMKDLAFTYAEEHLLSITHYEIKMTGCFKIGFTVYDTLIDQTLNKGVMHVKVEIF